MSALRLSENLKPKTSGKAETIGTTSNHPFWSEDRQEFVQAGSLEIGERLQTLSGDVKVVQQKLPRPGPQPVFNLEVHDEHVYFVGEDGVLVHNSKVYAEIAEGHSLGNIGKHLDVDGNSVLHLTRKGLAGDHVLPKQAIANAMAAAGVSEKSKAGQAIMAIQDSAQNLRLMNSRLNSSKGARNAVEWMSTELGSKMPRRYIQNILRKQYKNAVEINVHLNKAAGTKGVDYFSDFWGR
ncbi:MAG: polymorphic toxin-type HINT domain-containing protein [Planctomycetaceae bacterium]